MLEQHYHLEHSIHSLARYEPQPIYRMLALLHSLGSPTSTNLRLAPVGDTNGKLRSRATFRCLLIDGLCVHANYPSRSPIWNSQLHIHTRTPGFLRPAQQRPHAGQALAYQAGLPTPHFVLEVRHPKDIAQLRHFDTYYANSWYVYLRYSEHRLPMLLEFSYRTTLLVWLTPPACAAL